MLVCFTVVAANVNADVEEDGADGVAEDIDLSVSALTVEVQAERYNILCP